MMFLMHVLIFGLVILTVFFEKREYKLMMELVMDPQFKTMDQEIFVKRTREIVDFRMLKWLAGSISTVMIIARIAMWYWWSI